MLTMASVTALPINTRIVKAETTSAVGVQYTAHVQNIDWHSPVSDGQDAGTDGQSLRIEAIEIRVVKTADVTITPPPGQNCDETIVVPGPIRNIYNGAYGEWKGGSSSISPKNSITYDGKWTSKMDETLRKFASGFFNEQDIKNIWLNKYIDRKYKVTGIRTREMVVPNSADNLLDVLNSKGFWNLSPSSSVHFDVTLVYSSNHPDFKASRLVIDLTPIN